MPQVPLQEHATEIFAILAFIVALLLGIIGTMVKFWLVDMQKWKTEIRQSLDGLKDELHQELVKMWRHISVIEGRLQIPSIEEINGDTTREG